MALTVIGSAVSSFAQSGNAEWQTNGWELDRLIVPMSGAYSQLSTYIAGLSMWAPSSIDANMYLADWTIDNHKQFPTVHLIYIGKKGGVLPPDRSHTGESIQQARFTTFSGKSFVDITYIGPTSSKVIWKKDTAIDVATIGPVTPADATVVWFVSKYDTSEGLPPGSDAAALAKFIQKTAETGESEELVPGKYYRGVAHKTNLLFSSQA